jgi:uncharacterized membrane protein
MPSPSARTVRWLGLLAAASLLGLIFLCLAWELWLAPLRPGGSWLVLKTLPLLAPLFGIMRGKRYTYQWSSLMILIYVAEATVRTMSDSAVAARLASIELGLTIVFFISAVLYARLTRPGSPAA